MTKLTVRMSSYGGLVDEYEAFVQWIEIARGSLTGTGNGTLVVVTGEGGGDKEKEKRRDDLLTHYPHTS